MHRKNRRVFASYYSLLTHVQSWIHRTDILIPTDHRVELDKMILTVLHRLVPMLRCCKIMSSLSIRATACSSRSASSCVKLWNGIAFNSKYTFSGPIPTLSFFQIRFRPLQRFEHTLVMLKSEERQMSHSQAAAVAAQ